MRSENYVFTFQMILKFKTSFTRNEVKSLKMILILRFIFFHFIEILQRGVFIGFLTADLMAEIFRKVT